MARSHFEDMKGPLSRALRKVAEAGPASVLAPVWGEVVGAALSERSRPVLLQDGVLTVEADPTFIEDFERARATLLERLNARLGRNAVRTLRFLRQAGRR